MSFLRQIFIALLAFFVGRYFAPQQDDTDHKTSQQDINVGTSETYAIPFPKGYDYCHAKFPSTKNYRPLSRQNYSLQQLHIFSRHGDRSPSISLPVVQQNAAWDVCPPSPELIKLPNATRTLLITNVIPSGTSGYWPGRCNLGQLTTKGIKQMTSLGKSLRDIYFGSQVKWVTEKIDIVARSTDVRRTIQSAQAFLEGFLTNDADPFPLHIHPLAIDSLSVPFPPGYGTMHRYSSRFGAYEERASTLAKELNTIMNITVPIPLSRWFDVLQCRKCQAYPMPCSSDERTCITEDHSKQTEKLMHEWLQLEYDYTQPEHLRMRTGPLLNELLRTMDDTGYTGTIVYSAHDTTLSALLASLGMTDEARIWPPYASNLIFEVWRRWDGVILVRTLYNGDITGGDALCELQAFVDKIKQFLSGET